MDNYPRTVADDLLLTLLIALAGTVIYVVLVVMYERFSLWAMGLM